MSLKRKIISWCLAVAALFLISSPGVGQPPPKKGTLKVRLGAWPKSLNYYNSGDTYTSMISLYHVNATLLSQKTEDNSNVPYLAESWEISDDKKSYTFHLSKKATFSDGSSVTAEDVKFTYDLVYDQKRCVLCEPQRSFIGPMESITIINPSTIKITMKNIHFENLERIGGLPILQKKRFSKGDFNRDFEKVMEGAGP